jgi:hypothetical protein
MGHCCSSLLRSSFSDITLVAGKGHGELRIITLLLLLILLFCFVTAGDQTQGLEYVR